MTDKEIQLAKLTMDAIRVINQIALEQDDYRIAQAGNTIAERLNALVVE